MQAETTETLPRAGTRNSLLPPPLPSPSPRYHPSDATPSSAYSAVETARGFRARRSASSSTATPATTTGTAEETTKRGRWGWRENRMTTTPKSSATSSPGTDSRNNARDTLRGACNSGRPLQPGPARRQYTEPPLPPMCVYAMTATTTSFGVIRRNVFPLNDAALCVARDVPLPQRRLKAVALRGVPASWGKRYGDREPQLSGC